MSKGFPGNKLSNLVRWAEKPAYDYGRAFRPTPQEVVEYFFIWKSLSNQTKIFTAMMRVKVSYVTYANYY
jgi:hypothetical protein